MALAAELGDTLVLADARRALRAIAGRGEARALPAGLASRQAEILGLAASGLSNREIGERLDLQVPTVERHVANVYRQATLRGRVAATAFAIRHGLVGR